MVEIRYTKTQINELKENKYVKNCTQKHIIFSKECKNESIKLLQKNFSTREIFKKLWFPEYIINSKIPSKSLNRWKKTLKENWITELKKWRPKKVNVEKMSKDEYIKHLEMQLAVYEELKKYMINSPSKNR